MTNDEMCAVIAAATKEVARLQERSEKLETENKRLEAEARGLRNYSVELEAALREIAYYGMSVPAEIANDRYLAWHHKCSAYDMIGIAARALDGE